MTVKFNDFEINIEAKCTNLSDDYNELDTFYFLNQLVMMAHDAAEANAVAGYPFTADSFKEGSQQLFQQLKDMGWYKTEVAEC